MHAEMFLIIDRGVILSNFKWLFHVFDSLVQTHITLLNYDKIVILMIHETSPQLASSNKKYFPGEEWGQSKQHISIFSGGMYKRLLL